MDPQVKHGEHQYCAHKDVHLVLERALRRRLVVQDDAAAHVGLVHFHIHCGKGKTSELLARWCRCHKTHGDDHHRAHHEHEDGVVEEVGVKQCADGGRCEVLGFIQHFK